MMRHFFGIVLVLSAAACDDAVVRQATPAGPTEPSPRTVSYSVRIVSGADGSPVRGAAVVIEGQTLESGDDGRVDVVLPFGAWATDVSAVGFLPRRTTTAANQTIALWPIASEAEADAVRRMVYERGAQPDGFLFPPDSDQFLLTITDTSDTSSPAWSDAWRREATAFGSMFGVHYALSYVFQDRDQ